MSTEHMKTLKIDHVGIAVKSAEKSAKLFSDVLGLETEEEILNDRKLKIIMIKVGKSRLELLEDLDVNGTIAKFIEKRGEGLHHIAFEVDDINETLKKMKENGYRVLSEPSAGADNTMVAFIHPKDTHGVLIELVERSSQKR